MQAQLRFAAGSCHSFHKSGADTLAETRSQCFYGGLFGRKTSCYVADGQRRHGGKLFGTENFFGKAASEARETFFYTRKFNNINAQADNHASFLRCEKTCISGEYSPKGLVAQ